MPVNDGKRRLLEEFWKDYKRYYYVRLFEEEGFVRRSCVKCGRYFWTLDPDRQTCPNQPCQEYEFIGNPPTPNSLGYVEAWRTIERFFVKNGHTSVPRYPVVARWRPDLYFTVASIVDFQRVEAGKIIFELPANPLIVPQACLRFNDVENVGFSGRHFTEFVMIGQHALNDEKGYWKDETIDLDFRLLVEEFKVPKEEVVFVEDVWLGYGAFGYSLEYFVRGLELGNAVFTEFEGTPEDYKIMKPQVVDMGAGLERFVWLTFGTPTSYDAVFKNELDKLLRKLGVSYDERAAKRYFSVSGRYDLTEAEDPSRARLEAVKDAGLTTEEYLNSIKPLEDLYVVLDHVRALLFAITDGALPSNVGGGYNLRVVYRRALGVVERNSWDLDLVEVAELIAGALKPMFSELSEALPSVQEIFDVERKRYESTKIRARRIIERLKRRPKPLTTGELITLYESHGITPEMLVESGVIKSVPPDFYPRLTEKHTLAKTAPQKPATIPGLEGLPPTRPLYYEDKMLSECRARVLKVVPEYNAVVLDQTVFYPRGGGQEPDHGYINGSEVYDVEKYGEVIVHFVRGRLPREGDVVECRIDKERRFSIMRHHTATHIINGAARALLGPWVWQNSAYKDEDKARLDITHHSHLTQEQIEEIERLANRIVQLNLPVETQILPRGRAEKLYGFRLYQGGAYPSRYLRVVKIGDFDIEACGGTHCSTTGEVGSIKILRAERIQDGVERLEFVAGPRAVEYVQRQDRTLQSIAAELGSPVDQVTKKVETIKESLEAKARTEKVLAEALAEQLASSTGLSLGGGVYLTTVYLEDVPRETLIRIGDKLIKRSRNKVYIGLSPSRSENKTTVVVLSPDVAIGNGYGARLVLQSILDVIGGGSGGGSERIAIGGAPKLITRDEFRVVIEGLRTRLASSQGPGAPKL